MAGEKFEGSSGWLSILAAAAVLGLGLVWIARWFVSG
jgi:hypothetical protein